MLRVIFQKDLWIVLVLGFASGLPLGLTGSLLEAWLTTSGLDLATIGMFKLAGQPYVFKFAWAPAMDSIKLPFGTHRRAWLLVLLGAMASVVFCMRFVEPTNTPILLACLAFVVAALSATFDIVVDAFRTELIQPDARGLAAAMAVSGYRIAMLTSGGLGMIMAHHIGFESTFSVLALCFLIAVPFILWSREPVEYVQRPKLSIEAFKAPVREFFSRDKAVALLAIVICYKLCDVIAASMATPFLLRGLEFTIAEVGQANKLLGFLAALSGTFVGGVILMRVGLWRCLFTFGILQALANLSYAALAMIGHNYIAMYCAVFVENFCGGLGTASLVAFVMALCDKRYTATQYALFTAISAFGRVNIGAFGGYMAQSMGWVSFFSLSALFAIPGLLLIWQYRDLAIFRVLGSDTATSQVTRVEQT